VERRDDRVGALEAGQGCLDDVQDEDPDEETDLPTPGSGEDADDQQQQRCEPDDREPERAMGLAE
jgi:hypothetical protein